MSQKTIKLVYEQLKNQFDLKLTNTFALENGIEDFREDFEILCGNSSAGSFQLFHDGHLFVFDVDKHDGSYVHWHPMNIPEIIEDIQNFMQGYSKY